ncbi:hypothetical protein [Streptomyces sp. NPDC059802]|uniref:hypothetical protein n=1 Tax=Streptomyces sp. NPDC059802 TaxID=3346952 RepID=UPI0036689183
MTAFVALMGAVWGIRLTVRGGSSRPGQQRGVSFAVLQVAAIVPLSGHFLLVIVSLARLVSAVSGES